MSFFYRAIRSSDFVQRGMATSLENGPQLIEPSQCLPGRPTPPPGVPTTSTKHVITGRNLLPPYPDNMEVATFAMGCFWCAESIFAKKRGIYITAVGYANGVTPNPTYEEVTTGETNHAEAVLIIFDPSELKYEDLLKDFWEKHDPTTPMKQGNDSGTQYRSAIFVHNQIQLELAQASKELYQAALLTKRIVQPICTEIEPSSTFYYAEEYHQQFDAKPGSRQYGGLRPTGAQMPKNF